MTTDRLVCLHGFTQTHHHWHRVAHAVAARIDGRTTLAFVDLPGHGLADEDRAGSIDDVGPRLAHLGGPGTWIGYSMGGRMALVAAVAGAPEIERLVLIGATPGIEDADQRCERVRLDVERAEWLEQIGVDAFLDEWLASPMFAGLPPDPVGLAHRRTNTIAGLAHSLRQFGTGRQTPLWDRLRGVHVPVLVLAGEHDAKFTEIGRRMAERLPRATFSTVGGAGHAAHAEQPAATATLIADWLRGRGCS